jgi:hypothetical protein
MTAPPSIRAISARLGLALFLPTLDNLKVWRPAPSETSEHRCKFASASGKSVSGFPARSATKQRERFREKREWFSRKKRDQTTRALPGKV